MGSTSTCSDPSLEGVTSTIADKLRQIIPSLPPSISKIIIHVGSKDVIYKRSEITKQDFNRLFTLCHETEKSIFISGPIPTSGRGDESYSRLMNLNTWLQSAARANGFHFIDNFKMFWKRTTWYARDGLHLNGQGSQHLMYNIRNALLSAPRA